MLIDGIDRRESGRLLFRASPCLLQRACMNESSGNASFVGYFSTSYQKHVDSKQQISLLSYLL